MALTTLANSFQVSVAGTITKAEELSTLTDVISKVIGVTFALGTGANQGDGFFHDSVPLAQAANHTKDFTDSSLTDKLGEAVNFSKLKAIAVKNNSTNSTLIVGATGANQMAIFGANTERIVIQPGGVFVYICPDSSGLDISVNAKLKFEHGNEGASAPDYDFMILGVQG